MADIHRLKITGGPATYQLSVSLDDKPLFVSGLEITAHVNAGIVMATLTMPVDLDIDADVDAMLFREVLPTDTNEAD